MARGAPQGSYAHPLQQQLDALRYPAWLLEAPDPQPPKVCHQPTSRYGRNTNIFLLHQEPPSK